MTTGNGRRAAGCQGVVAFYAAWLWFGAFVAVAWFGAASGTAAQTPSLSASPLETMIQQAYDSLYNLDHDEALAAARKAVAAGPDESRAHRVLAAVLYIGILFDRGTVTLDHFLGGVTKKGLGAPPPPPAADAEFKRELARAIELAEAALKKTPHDIDARFDAGSAYALQASYSATIEGSMTSAFRSAKRAYDAQETVLQSDPSRASAGVVVGTYRYVVSGLAVPTRMFAYMMGFGGGKETGINLLQAASQQRESRLEARTALLLIFTRERRYADALRVARELEADFPRNRLFTLEVGSSALRADQYADAEAVFTRGLAALDKDPRRKLAGERALWLYKRGATRVRMNHLADARVDLDTALTHSPPAWVRGRVLMELGKIADLGGKRAEAVATYKQARATAVSVEDNMAIAAIDQWLRRPYTLPGK